MSGLVVPSLLDHPGVSPVWPDVRDDPERTVEESCCAATAELAAARHQTPGDWLADYAGRLLGIVAPGAACWAVIARQNTIRGDWTIQGVGFRRPGEPGFRKAAMELPTGWFDRVRDAGELTADEVGAEAPAGDAVLTFLRSLGVHRRVRCARVLKRATHPRWLITDLGGLDAGWRVTSTCAHALLALSLGAARAYSSTFLRLEAARDSLISRLPAPTRDTLALLAQGLTEAQIARRVGRSPHTVHDHAKQVYRALGVTNRAELRALWMGESAPD